MNTDLVLRGDVSTTITISNDSTKSNSQNSKPQYNPLGIDSYQSCFICTNTSLILHTINFALAEKSEREEHKTSHCSLIHSSHITATNCNFIISVGASPFIVFETSATLDDKSSSLTLVSSSISNAEGIIGSFSDFASSTFEGTHFTQVISSSDFRSSSLLHGDGIAIRQPHLTFPSSSLFISSTISSTSFRNMSSPATQNRRPNFHFSQNAIGCDLHSTANHLYGCPFRGLDKGGSFSCRNTTFTALMEPPPTPDTNAPYEQVGETFTATSGNRSPVHIDTNASIAPRALAIVIQKYDNSVIIYNCYFTNLTSSTDGSTRSVSGAVLIEPALEEYATNFEVQIKSCYFENCFCIGGPGAICGGAVEIDMKGSLNLISTSISGSVRKLVSQEGKGSALQITKCDYLLVRDCLFDSNRQSFDSSVYVENVTQARFSSCIFSNNEGDMDYAYMSLSCGAFMAIAAIRLELTGCSFLDNKGHRSAAMFLGRYVESVVMDDTLFYANYAYDAAQRFFCEELLVIEQYVSEGSITTTGCTKGSPCSQLTDALACQNDQKTKITISGAFDSGTVITLEGSIELAGIGTENPLCVTSFKEQPFKLAESSSAKICALKVSITTAPFVTQDTPSDLLLSEILVSQATNEETMNSLLLQSAGTSLITLSSFKGRTSPSLIRISGNAKATISDVLFTEITTDFQVPADFDVKGLCVLSETSGDVSILRCGFESTQVQAHNDPVYLDGTSGGTAEVQWCRFADTIELNYQPSFDLVAVGFGDGKLNIDYSTIEMLRKDVHFKVDGVMMRVLPPPFLIYESDPEDLSSLNWRDRKPQKADTLHDTGLQTLLHSLNHNIHTKVIVECGISAEVDGHLLKNCSIQVIFRQEPNLGSTITCNYDVTFFTLDESSFDLRQVEVQVNFNGPPLSPLFSLDSVSSLRLDTVQFEHLQLYHLPSIVKSTGGSATLHKIGLVSAKDFSNPLADMVGGVLSVSETLLEDVTITSGALFQTTGTSVNIMDSSFVDVISDSAQANVVCAELSGDQTIRVYGFHQNESEQVTFRNPRSSKSNLMIYVNGSTTIADPIYFSTPLPSYYSPRPARFSGGDQSSFVILEANTDLQFEGLTFCVLSQIDSYFKIDATSKMVVSNCLFDISFGISGPLFLCEGGILTLSDTEFKTNSANIITMREEGTIQLSAVRVEDLSSVKASLFVVSAGNSHCSTFCGERYHWM
ncbi:hypothetical protein BLNAU_8285 [Blattamonas nauphoetae]|uniref:Uncharacterized protein n=1 Tax=Blattamonas nauphoetae TaxID=2049346 RepID=A0ABQ9XZC8_9EUKA|nr:hypothetical protein BLNAU_8285 [Blattamonas nauphoetae]